MVRRWYPGGRQPVTAAPIFVPLCDESPGVEAALEGGTFKGPVLLQLHSATEGASIAYTNDPGDEPDWQLYGAPLRLPKGESATSGHINGKLWMLCSTIMDIGPLNGSAT